MTENHLSRILSRKRRSPAGPDIDPNTESMPQLGQRAVSPLSIHSVILRGRNLERQ